MLLQKIDITWINTNRAGLLDPYARKFKRPVEVMSWASPWVVMGLLLELFCVISTAEQLQKFERRQHAAKLVLAIDHQPQMLL